MLCRTLETQDEFAQLKAAQILTVLLWSVVLSSYLQLLYQIIAIAQNRRSYNLLNSIHF